MKAMILAAGLGTRLKPWTLEHPKALVPVRGVPMLERVMSRLKRAGFNDLIINIHHFGEQIMDYLSLNDPGCKCRISDERERLLDTGGGLLAASRIFFEEDDSPFLVHNVDILSDADLAALMRIHKEKKNDITLLTSSRASSRKLVFGEDGFLRGWHNIRDDVFRPAGFEMSSYDHESSFSGIYVIGKSGARVLEKYAVRNKKDSFPVMDFFLESMKEIKIGEFFSPRLSLIDIGKPATLEQANQLLNDDKDDFSC